MFDGLLALVEAFVLELAFWLGFVAEFAFLMAFVFALVLEMGMEMV